MIPKIIHQIYWDFSGKNKPPCKKWQEYQETWKKNFPEPEYKHILWNDKDSKELIKKYYNWFLKTYDNYPKNIQRADAVRYFILHRYGGIYADMDCEVRNNFYDKLNQEKPNIVEDCFTENGLMNNLMASPKKLDIWKEIFKLLEKKKKVRATLESTGPTLLTEGFYNKNLIHILDYQNFNPVKKRSSKVYAFFENALFTTLDYEKAKTWDIAEVVHHTDCSWLMEEFLDIHLPRIVAVLFILIIIFYAKRRKRRKIKI